MKICNQCNKTFSDDDVFCDICGEKLLYEENSVNTEENEKDSDRKKAIGVMAVLSVLLLVSVVVNFVMFSQKNDAEWYKEQYEEEKIPELEEKVEYYRILVKQYEEEKIPKLNREIVSYQEQAENTQKELTFYHNHIGLVGRNGEDKYYHRYGCEYFEGDFYGYNTEWAKKEGYKPCPTCFGVE